MTVYLLFMDPRVFAMDDVMQQAQNAVAAKPEDDGDIGKSLFRHCEGAQ